MEEANHTMDDLFVDGELTEKQRKIIIAAIETFSEKGFAATSTSEIAKKAGVAEGTIFKHFKTKKDLLISIITPIVSKMLAPFVIKDLYKVLDHQYEHYEDFLRAMIENRIAFVKNNTSLIKILIQEIPFHPELKELFVENIGKKTFERFCHLAEYYQKKGQIITIPPAAVVRHTISVILGYVAARYLIFPDKEWNDEQDIELTMQMLMRGLSAD